jgi:quercetin dioxygenase-like cupin family protein
MNAATRQVIVRHPLLTARLNPTKSTQRVEVKRIEFVPGQATGLHAHPCPVVGYIVAGSVLFQVDGEPARILRAGDAFFEPANHKMLHFDNASPAEPMTFIAFYLLDASDYDLIRMLE